MSSSFLKRSDLVLRYIGSDDIAATPRTLAESRVLSHRIRKAGGPAAMKSTDPDKSASFMIAGPPRSIHFTLRLEMPAAFACFSISRSFSMTSSGRKPTPPAPRGMRSSVTSPCEVAGLPLHAESSRRTVSEKHRDTKAQRHSFFFVHLCLCVSVFLTALSVSNGIHGIVA